MDSNAGLKQKHRAAGVAAREALEAEKAALLSRAICAKLAGHRFYLSAAVILSYKPYRGEVDISAFNEKAQTDGKIVAYPICMGKGRMVAAVPDDSNDFVKDSFGIDTPRESSSRILSPQDIDLVVVPCAAFDGSSKTRIGMGAGYYDRFLPLCKNAMRLAVAFDVQQIKGIRSDPWDVPMHTIITETRCYE